MVHIIWLRISEEENPAGLQLMKKKNHKKDKMVLFVEDMHLLLCYNIIILVQQNREDKNGEAFGKRLQMISLHTEKETLVTIKKFGN